MGMARERGMKKVAAGSWIENPVMGERSLLVKLPAETGGCYFEMEYICQPHKGRSAIPAHYHPIYQERFEILKGRARYLLGGKELTAVPGDKLLFPPRIVHMHPWNDGDGELHVRMFSESDPPDMDGLNANLNTGITLYGLARDGKVNKDGLPPFLQQAVSGNSTLPGACPAGLSVGAAKIILGAFATIGKMAGYRVSYPQYGEV